MAQVKTAISIDKALSEQVDKLADELELSRSQLFVLAVEAFIERHGNQQLLHQLNKAYDDVPLEQAEPIVHQMRSTHRNIVDGDW